MSKDKILPISIFSLAISIIISAYLISKGMENKGRFIADGISNGLYNTSNTINSNSYNNIENGGIFNLTSAAKYLGLSEERLMQIMNNEESKIPYIKVGSDFIFSKNALNKWVEETSFKM